MSGLYRFYHGTAHPELQPVYREEVLYDMVVEHHPEEERKLEWRWQRLRNNGVQRIAAALYHPRTCVQELDLANHSISLTGALALAKAIETYAWLRQLNLSSNPIGDEGVRVLANSLQSGRCVLESLSLAHASLSDSGAIDVAMALPQLGSLTSLVLSHNTIRDSGASALADTLCNHDTLDSLDLSYNYVSDSGAARLADSLPYTTTLECLVLGANRIGDTGAGALARKLMQNSSVEYLILAHNRITDAGARSLADALSHRLSAQKLYLYLFRTQVLFDSFAFTRLQPNTSLKTLSLIGNQLTDVGAQAFGESLEYNSTLESLFLSRNKIGDAGANALANGLKRKWSPPATSTPPIRTSIGAAGESLSPRQPTHICCARVRDKDMPKMVQPSGLKKLCLKGNEITDEGAQSFADALRAFQITTLEELDATFFTGISPALKKEIRTLLRLNSRKDFTTDRQPVKEPPIPSRRRRFRFLRRRSWRWY